MNQLTLLVTIALLFSGLVLTSCDTSKKIVGTSAKAAKKMIDPYIGTWDYIVKDTPEGDVEGQLVITKEAEQYTATLSGDAGTSDLQNFQIENSALQGTFDYQGYELTLKGAFEGNSLKGDLGVEYMSFSMEAKKREVISPN